jgi:hypothetical protein
LEADFWKIFSERRIMAVLPFNHGQLVGRQRAEFNRAAKLQRTALALQIAITAVASLAVLIDTPPFNYAFAITALVLAFMWAYVGWQYRSTRGQAERVRRVTLLMEGLGEPISQSELRDIWTGFTSSAAEGAALADSNYYDAHEGAGFSRLLEMLEETSFWSCHLMKASAHHMWVAFALSAIVSLTLFLISIVVIQGEQLQAGARLLCVFLTLGVSVEVIGAALAYQAASTELCRMAPRIDAIRANGFRQADVLMLLFDYNAAVEGAPMFLPGLYEREKTRLNALWQARKHATA